VNTISEKTNDILDRESQYLSYTTRVPYYPLVVEKARGCIVEDIEGNQFIDFLSSAAVINTGHNHPKVVKAISEQLEKFIHYTPAYMYHKPHTDLAEMLVRITPGDFPKRVAFALSGSVSSEGAVKAAKMYTGKNRVISCYRSYHGTTMGALSLSGYSPGMRAKAGTLIPDVSFIPYPDCYRCPVGMVRESCEEGCLKPLELLLDTVVPPTEVAALIYEPVQADGGVIVPPAEYMRKLHAICRQHNILMIADEVQTGFGRCGKLFGSELFDFAPDMLVLGKGIASGMPLSAIVARSEILEAWGAPIHFFNTAGNVLSCAASLATIDVIQSERVSENAAEIGEHIIREFKELQKIYSCIGDVRGVGLLIGVDIVKDRTTKERDITKTAKICWRCWENGLILAFFSGSVLRVAPPLVITKEEADRALAIIRQAIQDVEQGLVPDSVLEQIKGW